MKIHFPLIILISLLLIGGIYFINQKNTPAPSSISNLIQPSQLIPSIESQLGPLRNLTIQAQRTKQYQGSDLAIEQTLTPGSNYNRYIVSYLSDDLKIYGLLTVPIGQRPTSGWPVIIFNHGYIPPEEYRTTEKYVAYQDGFARNGYITFKPDYRGHGSSEGKPEGAYASDAYITDVLNALASLKKYSQADSGRIGMWGHSLGGALTLRALVVKGSDIKAAVIWNGVVGSYNDLLFNWRRDRPFTPSQREVQSRRQSLRQLVEKIGTPSATSALWTAIDPTYHLKDITAPVQLHTGSADTQVPPSFSEKLYNQLIAEGKTAQYYTYQGADHNLSGAAFTPAMQRSIEFFNTYLKTGK